MRTTANSNTSWGRNDLGSVGGACRTWRRSWTRGATQRRGPTFGAFLEVVLHERDEYRSFLANPATGMAWLGPNIRFVNEYAAADKTPIANFDEDADLTTGSSPGVRIIGTDLARSYEVQLPLNWDDLDTQTAVVGWNRNDAAKVPELRIDLPATVEGDRQSASARDVRQESARGRRGVKKPNTIDFTSC